MRLWKVVQFIHSFNPTWMIDRSEFFNLTRVELIN